MGRLGLPKKKKRREGERLKRKTQDTPRGAEVQLDTGNSSAGEKTKRIVQKRDGEQQEC
jgi:hypothetical protein